MSRAITLSFTEATIAMLDQHLARGEKSAFIEQAVIEKLHQLQRGQRVEALLRALPQRSKTRAGTGVRLLCRQRRAH